MPISPENRNRYPDNWKEISAYIRNTRANNKCEVCGLVNHEVIKRYSDGSYRKPSAVEWDMIHSRIKNSHSNMTESLKYHGFTKVILTVAHLDHSPENCDENNLKAMCQKCHNQYDAEHRKKNRLRKKLDELFSGVIPIPFAEKCDKF